MPQFSVNLSLLFNEVPLEARFQAAAEHGFSEVEIQFPYSLGIESIREQLRRHRLKLNLINFPAGDWAAGDRGIACDPARKAEFARGIDQALDYALALDCPQINCLAGILPAGVPMELGLDTLKGNLQLADRRLGEQGIRLNIEAINTRDIPGFVLHHSAQVIDLIESLELQNSYLQYDVYHMQIMEGCSPEQLERLLPHIGHIQIADVPGRRQPGTGSIDFNSLFKALDLLGYTGRVALEYNPLGNSQASFDWITPFHPR